MNLAKRKEWIKTGLLIGLFVVIINWQTLADRARGSVAYDAGRAGPVTVFSTEWCGYCKKTKHFLATHNVPFVERDVEKSSAAADAFARLGGRGVPLVLVGDQAIHGYSLGRLRAALECADCKNAAPTP